MYVVCMPLLHTRINIPRRALNYYRRERIIKEMIPQREINGFNNSKRYSESQEHLLEKSLQSALKSIGDGWDMEIIETVAENYNVDYKDFSEQTISDIECALRDLLGSAGDIFINRFYSELRAAGCAL
jgi:hypothetical protein